MRKLPDFLASQPCFDTSAAQRERKADQTSNTAALTDSFDALSHLVRYGLRPEQPRLMQRWLAQSKQAKLDDEALWLLHEHQFYLLLETLCDDLVPSHWRSLCLDHIYQPLMALNELAKSCELSPEQYDMAQARIRRLGRELTITGQYAAASLWR